MPINEGTDATIAEADRRAERAKASLRSRVEALKDKLGDTREQLNLGAKIANHPWPSVGVAFALGALAGLSSSRRGVMASPGRSFTGAALGVLAAFGVRLVRELAMGQLQHMAQQWWLRRERDAWRDEPAPGGYVER